MTGLLFKPDEAKAASGPKTTPQVPFHGRWSVIISRQALPDDPRQAQLKAARNQSLFREVNERIEHLQKGWAPISEIDFLCECADESCTGPISMTFSEYGEVRGFAARFFVLPEHVYPEVEAVVRTNERYWIVEKLEHAGQVAAALDPRRGPSAA